MVVPKDTNFPFEVVVCFVENDCPKNTISTFGGISLGQFLNGKSFKEWNLTKGNPESFHFITYPIRTLALTPNETPKEVRWKSVKLEGPSAQAVILKPGMVMPSNSSLFVD